MQETEINYMKKTRHCTSTTARFNDYKWEMGQMEKGGNSVYINLCAYTYHNDDKKLSTHFFRLNERLSHLVADSSSQLFPSMLNPNMPYILTHDNRSIKTRGNWTFFNIEVTLFFAEGVKLKDIQMELELLCYVITDYLNQEVDYLKFRSRK